MSVTSPIPDFFEQGSPQTIPGEKNQKVRRDQTPSHPVPPLVLHMKTLNPREQAVTAGGGGREAMMEREAPETTDWLLEARWQ